MQAHEIELKGRTAKAHIDKWQQLGEKAEQHKTSARLLIIEAQDALPHGKFLPWLDQHNIPASTAYKLISEHKSPEKAERRKERDRQYAADKRAKAQTSTNRGNSASATQGDEGCRGTHFSQTRSHGDPATDARSFIAQFIATAAPHELKQVADVVAAIVLRRMDAAA